MRERGTLQIPWRVAVRAYLNASNDGECRISHYSVGSHGYAQVGWCEGGSTHATTAHRAAWVFANGQQIPGEMTVDHLCKNRKCVQPLHLRLLSNYENARRTRGRDWPLGECAQGHSNEFLVTYSNGRTHCGVCVQNRYATPAGLA